VRCKQPVHSLGTLLHAARPYYSHTLFRVHTFLAGAYMQNASVTRRSASATENSPRRAAQMIRQIALHPALDCRRLDDTFTVSRRGSRRDRERDIGPRRLNGCV
jgi:hypothetical protein